MNQTRSSFQASDLTVSGALSQFTSRFIFLLALLLTFIPANLLAQSNTTGDITGTVTDSTGAIVPGSKVTLKSLETGTTQTTSSNSQGVYRFALLKPGNYIVSSETSGFSPISHPGSVFVNGVTTVNLQLAIATDQQSVEVTTEAPIVDTENGNISTTFTTEQVSQVPNPGNDLTAIVQTAPGAVMNTQAGNGNFSSFGISATSNLFTYDGQNENDPFLNLNNSGATNLLLGTNDVQEVAVVNNGYSGQYGGLAGANVNYVSKSGTNQFHGNAIYWWDGRALNANNFFKNRTDVPRPFVNANQYAASLGGPIRKDKTFFFVDYEGLRVVLPGVTQPVNVPSPQFEAATLAHLADPATNTFYQEVFNLWNNAPGAAKAVPLTSNNQGCGTLNVTGGAPCVLQFQSGSTNFTHEYLLTARVDQNISDSDRLFVRFRTDNGTQATYTDPINPVFDAFSIQPQYEGQLSESHNFGANAVNQLILSGSWSSATFQPLSLAAAKQAIPFALQFNDGTFGTLGNELFFWPQGRNVTQYQAVDDYSRTIDSHQLKFGINFRRNDVTDFDPGINSTATATTTLQQFFNGQAASFLQAFPQQASVPIALYSLGFYAQDEWRLNSKLKLTFALRGDHNSNPVCQTNCFARFADDFSRISHDPNQPFNQVIQTNQHQALTNLNAVDWQPRFGFAWQPFKSESTVVRGGFGLFSDAFPATVADLFSTNAPTENTFTASIGPLAPGANGSLSTQVAAANQSFLNAFANGGRLASITAANPNFVAPSLTTAQGRIHSPRYQEWNLDVEQALGQNMSFSLNYVGNHGIFEVVQNGGLNAFATNGFGGLPTAPVDSRFGTITEVQDAGVSNYNGLVASFQRRFRGGFQFRANYTWSHALDEVSNGGFLRFNFLTNTSVLGPEDPHNLKRFNYGNADYDATHYFSANYVWDVPFHSLLKHGPEVALNGWQLSGTIFVRSGLPFTAVDNNAQAILSGQNFNPLVGQIFANFNGQGTTSCGSSAVNQPCLSTANITPVSDPVTGTLFNQAFGNQRRNQFRGPRYFDTDLSVMKSFNIPHWELGHVAVGAQFFNLFNHPNFDQPIGDVANPQFGSIIAPVSQPTSIVGSFLGGDASPRLIQLTARVTF